EARFDRGVSTFRRTNRPRTAGIVGRRHQRVVASFPEARADWMDRRQIDHVEAEVGDARQERGGFPERAAATWVGSRRAREHLVPRTEARPLAIDPDAKR